MFVALVFLQTFLADEGPAAVDAFERTLARVQSLMAHKDGLGGVHAAAVEAFERALVNGWRALYFLAGFDVSRRFDANRRFDASRR